MSFRTFEVLKCVKPNPDVSKIGNQRTINTPALLDLLSAGLILTGVGGLALETEISSGNKILRRYSNSPTCQQTDAGPFNLRSHPYSRFRERFIRAF